MALTQETSVKQFFGNAVARQFDHAPHFTLSDASHLELSVNGVEVTAGYVQTTVGVIFDTPPATGAVIILRRTTPLDQPLTTDGLRVFALENIAAGFDRLVRALQDRLLSSDDPNAFALPLKFPPFEPLNNPTVLPMPAARGNTVFGFDPVTNEAVLYKLPFVVVPVLPAEAGTHILKSVDGVLSWDPIN